MDSFRPPFSTENIDSAALRELQTYTNSFHNVKQNVLSRTGINLSEESVIENEIEYKFYYLPIKATLNLILADEVAMEHIFEWNRSKFSPATLLIRLGLNKRPTNK